MLTDYSSIIHGQPSLAATPEEMQAYVRLIDEHLNAVIDTRAAFSHGQRNYLYRLRARWQARIDGTDLRWRKSCATTPAQTDQLDEDEPVGDPAILSLLRKLDS